MSTPKPDVTVVLPCAGLGVRFGAPYSKELHCLAPGVSVIDRSLETVVELAGSGLEVRVVVVFRAHKLDVVAHLAHYTRDVRMVFVYQDESFGDDLGGAIRTALPLAEGHVVLVLPDITLHGPGSEGSLVEAVRRTPASGWCVVAARTGPDALTELGALRLDGHGDGTRVVAAEEKPARPDGYNAAWAMVVASPEEAHRLPDIASRGADSPLVGAQAVEVAGFTNFNSALTADPTSRPGPPARTSRPAPPAAPPEQPDSPALTA
ncbi:hypothetical protein [Streptomyces sp. NPDC003247]|uniref:hypothetical protein n=1 Tax=Streptomyces sp. NPDC003247 TaxID=3364677 RepID=UPI0036A3D0F7